VYYLSIASETDDLVTQLHSRYRKKNTGASSTSEVPEDKKKKTVPKATLEEATIPSLEEDNGKGKHKEPMYDDLLHLPFLFRLN
jgi:hypothetical protein